MFTFLWSLIVPFLLEGTWWVGLLVISRRPEHMSHLNNVIEMLMSIILLNMFACLVSWPIVSYLGHHHKTDWIASPLRIIVREMYTLVVPYFCQPSTLDSHSCPSTPSYIGDMLTIYAYELSCTPTRTDMQVPPAGQPKLLIWSTTNGRGAPRVQSRAYLGGFDGCHGTSSKKAK
jgi:hypothetical protein